MLASPFQPFQTIEPDSDSDNAQPSGARQSVELETSFKERQTVAEIADRASRTVVEAYESIGGVKEG